MVKSKNFGHGDLKTAGLDGTWLPRGHFAESDFKCSNGHKMTHHPLVRNPLVTVHMKGDPVPQDIQKDLHVSDCDGIVKYTVDPKDGKVTITCSSCGDLLATYTPNPNFKNFDGQLPTHIDGKDISGK